MIEPPGIGAPVASRTSPAIMLLPLCAANPAVRTTTNGPEAATFLNTPKNICASPKAHAGALRTPLIEKMDWKTDRSGRPISSRRRRMEWSAD
jgi:hypothetical protein